MPHAAPDRRSELNIGPGEELVGIEVLDAKHVLGNGSLPTVVLENVPAVQG